MEDDGMKTAGVRVPAAMHAWMKAVGPAGVRAALQAAMDGVNGKAAVEPDVVNAAEALPVVEKARNTPKRLRVSKAEKTETEPAVVVKSAIPISLAEQVAAIAAKRDAKKKAGETMNPTQRLLAQYG